MDHKEKITNRNLDRSTWSESIDPQEFYQVVQLSEVVLGQPSNISTTTKSRKTHKTCHWKFISITGLDRSHSEIVHTTDY